MCTRIKEPLRSARGRARDALGLDFLRAHRVLVDNATRKMVFTYEGGPVFELGEPAE